MSGNQAFKDFLQGPSYCLKTTGVGKGAENSLNSKIVLKICWKLSFKYLATKDEAKLTSRAIAGIGVKVRNTARVLLILVGVIPANLPLPPKKRFLKRRQAKDQTIKLAK